LREEQRADGGNVPVALEPQMKVDGGRPRCHRGPAHCGGIGEASGVLGRREQCGHFAPSLSLGPPTLSASWSLGRGTAIIGGRVTTRAGTVVRGTAGTALGTVVVGMVRGVRCGKNGVVRAGGGGGVVGGVVVGGVVGAVVVVGSVAGDAVAPLGVACPGFVALVPALPQAVRPTPSATPSMTTATGLRSLMVIASPRWACSDYVPAAPRGFITSILSRWGGTRELSRLQPALNCDQERSAHCPQAYG
jgi:hypothetical protein